jgi:hypothetical protein
LIRFSKKLGTKNESLRKTRARATLPYIARLKQMNTRVNELLGIAIASEGGPQFVFLSKLRIAIRLCKSVNTITEQKYYKYKYIDENHDNGLLAGKNALSTWSRVIIKGKILEGVYSPGEEISFGFVDIILGGA